MLLAIAENKRGQTHHQPPALLRPTL